MSPFNYLISVHFSKELFKNFKTLQLFSSNTFVPAFLAFVFVFRSNNNNKDWLTFFFFKGIS